MKDALRLKDMIAARLSLLPPCNKAYKSFVLGLSLKEDMTVWDYGCNNGSIAFFAAKKLINGCLICTDPKRENICICRHICRKFDNIVFIDESVDKIEQLFCFDVIYCHFSLSGINANLLKKTIKTFALALNRNGRLIMREDINKVNLIKIIGTHAEECGLRKQKIVITDIPFKGNVVECVYIKN